MELDDKDFSVMYDEVNTGEVEDICTKCVYCGYCTNCSNMVAGYNDKGDGIIVSCKIFLDNNKN